MFYTIYCYARLPVVMIMPEFPQHVPKRYLLVPGFVDRHFLLDMKAP